MLKCQPHGINDEIPMGFKGDRLSCNALDSFMTRGHIDGEELSLIPFGALNVHIEGIVGVCIRKSILVFYRTAKICTTNDLPSKIFLA